jgi:hypothetical protein
MIMAKPEHRMVHLKAKVYLVQAPGLSVPSDVAGSVVELSIAASTAAKRNAIRKTMPQLTAHSLLMLSHTALVAKPRFPILRQLGIPVSIPSLIVTKSAIKCWTADIFARITAILDRALSAIKK